MIKHVVRVVSVEGPVHESEIVVRIRSLWGLARAGNRIRDAVLAAVKAAKRKGEIVGGPFYSLPGQEVLVRDRSEFTQFRHIRSDPALGNAAASIFARSPHPHSVPPANARKPCGLS
jgi:hypothetical protein